MNKILLITTKGCASCSIMNRLIKEALNDTHKDIVYEVKDCKNADKSFLHENRIKDYPSTCFIRDNKFKYVYVGTAHAIVINRFIDIHFK